ncbi:MAG: HDIG domain-containing protein [Desulfobacteraceae bacterium]
MRRQTPKRKPFTRSAPWEVYAKWLMLGLVVILFTFMLYPSLVVQRFHYRLGDIAERDIKAPQDFFIEDAEATSNSRAQAVDAVLTVYDHDPRIARQISDNVEGAFKEMRAIIDGFREQPMAVALADLEPEARAKAIKLKIDNELWAQKGSFESKLGIKLNRGAYKILIQESFSEKVAQLITKILNDILANGVVANKEVLLKESDRGITVRNVASQTEKIVTALRQHYGPDQAKTMVRIIAEPLVKDIDYNLASLIVDVCQRLVQPNLTLNRNETETRKAKALASIKPVMYKFKSGEMLVREGERITDEQLQILKALSRQEESGHIAATGMGAALVVAAFIFIVHVLYFRDPRHTGLNTNKNLLFMSLLMVMVFGMVKMAVFFSAVATSQLPFSISSGSVVYAAPAAAGAMLVCIFLGFDMALPFSLVASVCVALLFDNRIEIFVYFLISSAMGAYWVQHCRERKVFIIAGLKLGLLNMLLAAAASFYAADYSGFKLVGDWIMAFSGGIVSAVVAVGVAPLWEMAFRYTTDITLLELANVDRPILRRLMLEAPGTYHHSVIVGSLVEAAAAEIGANPLRAKVCGYYHDIGKVRKPLYFIENQSGGKNKHDKLAPSMSSLILIAHVKDGIEIAKQDKLGQVIIDTIQQHHGTSLISYFFIKAQQLKGADAVKEDDFRYPGPRPQTKEAGLVMLADVVEAASRTLENPTPARIQGLVQHLVNKIFSDGQLDHCELTLKDLHSIAKSFIKILTGIHHHRIEYSDTPTKETSRNGHTDRKSTEKSSRQDSKHQEESPGHLKRLGLP